MDFTGRVILDLPLESGIGKASGKEWRKKSWVLETFGQYPRKVKVDAMGQAIDALNLQLGKVYTVSVDLESREFNGRWYSDIRAYAAHETQDGGMGMASGVTGAPVAAAPQPTDPFSTGGQDPFSAPAAPAAGAPGADAFGGGGDDLPF